MLWCNILLLNCTFSFNEVLILLFCDQRKVFEQDGKGFTFIGFRLSLHFDK